MVGTRVAVLFFVLRLPNGIPRQMELQPILMTNADGHGETILARNESKRERHLKQGRLCVFGHTVAAPIRGRGRRGGAMIGQIWSRITAVGFLAGLVLAADPRNAVTILLFAEFSSPIRPSQPLPIERQAILNTDRHVKMWRKLRHHITAGFVNLILC